ncbi:hypothetical protein ASF24_13830 [Methylobacterium sp. Leaf86]|uniref:hypothetical protein n=1 Tax=Methylobacterium sp. Leaf86 TaxID=1736242 RepID=UPI0007021D17|nr:hypothetical protein [Methylobacterium sp. Leaf86]KQO59235.1 hypothetical protein ASF24_13830 [Methylobacterium sp. Leaf86]
MMLDLSRLTIEARERSRAEFMDRLRAKVLDGVTPEALDRVRATQEHMRRVTAPGYVFPGTLKLWSKPHGNRA